MRDRGARRSPGPSVWQLFFANRETFACISGLARRPPRCDAIHERRRRATLLARPRLSSPGRIDPFVVGFEGEVKKWKYICVYDNWARRLGAGRVMGDTFFKYRSLRR